MLIVTADHGITFVPGETYRDKINPLSRGTLEDIYRIPLFIKYPRQESSSISDCAASSIDLLATIIDVTNVKPEWETQGKSLFSSCPQRKFRTLRWPGGETKLTTSFNGVLERVSYYNQWIRANGDVDGIYRSGLSGSLLGIDTPSEFESSTAVTWSLVKPESYENFGSEEFSPIIGRASGSLYAKKQICDKCEALIAINGKFVGVVSELAGMKPSSSGKYFSSSLMTRLMQPGKAQVELWIANWTSGKPVLRRVGPPRNAVLTASK
jgi:hypothetical protein